MAYHYIVGLQSLNVSATVKHFVGYSLPEQGLNTAPVQGGERYLRSTYVCILHIEDENLTQSRWLPSFKRAIVDAGAWSIMSAYHA